jgi:surface antigen
MSKRVLYGMGWTSVLLALAGLVVPAMTWANPPPWAPAHGWRKKNDPDYVGYTGKKWPKDYGVIEGNCNRAAIGAVLGGAVGGAVGSTVGKGDGRTVAIIVGTVLGAAIGAKIGKDMDQVDRACIGHALELGGDRHGVTWLNEETGVRFLVTPVRGFERDGQQCREFTTRTTYKNKVAEDKGKACRVGDGEWRML